MVATEETFGRIALGFTRLAMNLSPRLLHYSSLLWERFAKHLLMLLPTTVAECLHLQSRGCPPDSKTSGFDPQLEDSLSQFQVES